MAGLQSREGRTMTDSVSSAQYINVTDRQPRRHSKCSANALRQAATRVITFPVAKETIGFK